MTFRWKNIEDNASPAIRAIRIILLVMIVVGIGLLITRSIWVPKLVDYIVSAESTIPLPLPETPLDSIPVKNKPSIACTMEAKICPDGSAVGRTGPNCEFAPCPGADNAKVGVISGFVGLSPICPVERMPPDPRCAPKPYETEIKIFNTSSNVLVKTIRSKTDGSFNTTLPYGSYTMEAIGGSPLPRCSAFSLRLNSTVTNKIEIFCDTGIR